MTQDLIARVEAATADEQREVLEAAYEAAFPSGTHRQRGQTGWQSDNQRCRFRRLLDAEAYLDAAMMLVPASHEWSVNWCGNSAATVSELPDGDPAHGYASTPALALCAAALRARGEA